MKDNKKVELLAPAGNMEAFFGAIHAGADAVYLGGSRFGARAYADNFTEEELTECIRYAHLWGRKVYLTVNTLVKEAELGEIYDYLRPFYQAGLDGVIVQDIGAFACIRDCFPQMELHVSTQMTVTGKYGAKLLQEMGACRVVPARELSLDEIAELKVSTGLAVECFIHGAMCYCYSGQCLFSSILGGRSGNRGRCAQPCRLPYRVQEGRELTRECYPLSLKDMCTIEYIPELIRAGIDSFKIEGRMKKPEYAAGVTAIYRKYIDAYYSAPRKPFRVSPDDLQKLSGLYIRSQRQDGYYHKRNGKEMVTLTQPSYSGSDEALLKEIRSTYLEQTPKRSIAIYGSFRAGEAASVTFTLEELSVTVEGNVVQRAEKQPITRENVEKQLRKLGDGIFRADVIEVCLDEQVFFPLKEINELRRQAASQLEEELIRQNGFPVRRELAENGGIVSAGIQGFAGKPELGNWAVSVRTKEQLEAVLPYLNSRQLARLYVNGDLFLYGGVAKLLESALENGNSKVILTLPYISRHGDETYLEELLQRAAEHSHMIKGFQVRCLEEMGFLKNRHYRGDIYADAGLYFWNSRTLEVWADDLAGFCIPYELKASEQKPLLCHELIRQGRIAAEKVFYGRIPMMVTANCVVCTTGGCKKGQAGEAQVHLIDRYQKRFPVVLDCRHCMNIIYNSVPLSLHREWRQWSLLQPNMAARLDFTVENGEETRRVLDFFRAISENERADDRNPPYKDYTTGHEKRGVE